MLLRSATAIVLAVGVAACAIHPLPENLTGVTSEVIVARVRCEARQGVREAYLTYLTGSGAEELSALLADADPPTWPTVVRQYDVKHPINYYRQLLWFGGGAIAYDFTFDMTEMNNVDPTLKGTKPMTSGTRIFGLSASADRTRHAIRDFSITDSFGGLLNIPSKECEGKLVGPNYIYPITGEIGLREMTDTFVRLWLIDKVPFSPAAEKKIASLDTKITKENTSLADKKIEESTAQQALTLIEGQPAQPSDPKIASVDSAEIAKKQARERLARAASDIQNSITTIQELKKERAQVEASKPKPKATATKSSPVLTDTFEFTTSWSATITPELQFNALRHVLRLSDGTFPVTNSRKDVHKVIVGLATADAPFSPSALPLISGFGNQQLTTAQQSAMTGVANHILRFEVLPRAFVP
jgi:hypothetical protein